MKRKVLLFALGVLSALPMLARDFEYTYKGQTLTYTVISEEEKTCETKAGLSVSNYNYTPGNEVAGELTIPSKVSDGANIYTVTALGEYAFSNCSGLTSVIIPGSVTSIGNEAFVYCSGLKKAEFASIEALCRLKFMTVNANPLGCANHLYINGEEITQLVIPESVTSIGSCAFYCCSGLTSVTIPESVTSIGFWAFAYCWGLKKAEFASIEALCRIKFEHSYANPLYAAHHLYINGEEITQLVIPESVTSTGGSTFAGCSGLTSVTIPESVTSIGGSTFAGCSGLTSVPIPGSVTNIGSSAFWGCSGLKSVTIPESVTSIGYNVFEGCSGLTSVTIPGSVTRIDGYAFRGCRGLKSVTIPGSVTSIGDEAFKGCSGLTYVTIPASVTSIGDEAFDGCSGLTKVYYGADKPITANDNVFSTDTYENATLYMSEIGVVMAGAIAPWNNFKKIEEYDVAGIEEITTDIDAARPYEVYNLNGVKIGNSLENLANGIYIVRQGSKTFKVAL